MLAQSRQISVSLNTFQSATRITNKQPLTSVSVVIAGFSTGLYFKHPIAWPHFSTESLIYRQLNASIRFKLNLSSPKAHSRLANHGPQFSLTLHDKLMLSIASTCFNNKSALSRPKNEQPLSRHTRFGYYWFNWSLTYSSSAKTSSWAFK